MKTVCLSICLGTSLLRLWIFFLGIILFDAIVKEIVFLISPSDSSLLMYRNTRDFCGLILYSVHFSHSVVSDSLRPHELQHVRPPYPSPTIRVHPNPYPLSRWCHSTISSSVMPFSSCLQSFPASGSFPMSQLFESGGQSIGVSASTSILPMNTQDWSPLGWTGWISLQSKGLSRVFPTPQFKSINSSVLSFLNSPTLTSIRDHWKNHSLD